MISPSSWLAHRLPFYYGWVVIAVAFVSMGIGVNSRTAFSLLYPPILDEFGWERGVTAAAFSLGFAASVVFAPFTGVLMDRYGPRVVISMGAALVSLGLALATRIGTPIGLYLTLGFLVVGGSVFISYIGHSAFLPRWFVRRRGLAVGIAFSGVGVGSIILFPLLQSLIGTVGWREACLAMAALIVVTLIPLNVLFQRTDPRQLGLAPDGVPPEPGGGDASDAAHADNVVDPGWAGTTWTVRAAVRTAPYWWTFLGLITALYAWYTVQVHQTRYFIEVGLSPADAAWALGLVGLTGIIGQIGLGHLSDRIGREIGWTLACGGYALCYALLIVLPDYPSPYLMYAIAAAQGVLGYGVAPIYGAIVAELFQGKHFGAVFGTLSVATTLGAASGPWVTGVLYDVQGNYTVGFAIALGCAVVSAGCMWLAAPRKVRLVAGRAEARRRARDAASADAAAPAPSSRPAPAAPTRSPASAPAAAPEPPAHDRTVLLAEPPRAVQARAVADSGVRAVAIRTTPIVLAPGESRLLEAHPLDGQGREVRAPLAFEWQLDGALSDLGLSLDRHEEDRRLDGKRTLIRAGERPGEGYLIVTVQGSTPPIATSRRVSVIAPAPDD